MPCPNYIVCGDTSETGNTCYNCDGSNYGWFTKKLSVMRGTIPNVVESNAYPGTEYYIEYEEGGKELYENIKEKGKELSILKIEEINHKCPVCLEEKEDFYVTHPTCMFHKLCKNCFKDTFCDSLIEYNHPESPESYRQYLEILEELDELFDTSEKELSEDEINSKEDWTEEKKNIYREGILYERMVTEYDRDYETRIAESSNLRACPVCRETKLKI